MQYRKRSEINKGGPLSASKKRKKQYSDVRISPSVPSTGPLPRAVTVSWRNGNFKKYWLTHLSAQQVHDFWLISDQEKLHFLKKKFNRHHRRPRNQNGPTNRDNLSNVDIESHDNYNVLISMTAKFSRLPVEKVKTTHIWQFIRRIYPVIQRLAVDSDTGNLKELELFIADLNEIWLPKDDLIKPELQPHKI